VKIEQIHQFLVVARTGSINRASQELYLSQAALSQSIQKLETEVDSVLFTRTPFGVSLTDAGLELYSRANRIYPELSDLQNFKKQSTVPSAKLHMACFNALYINHAYCALCQKYESKNPDFSISDVGFTETMEKVASGECEIGISMVVSSPGNLSEKLLESMNLISFNLSTFDLYIMLRKNHPCLQGGAASLSVSDLEPYAYTLSAGKLKQSDLYEIFSTSKRERNTIWVCSRDCMLELIQRTDAFTTVPWNQDIYCTEKAFPESLRIVPLRTSDVKMKLICIQRKDAALSRPARDFLALLQKELRIQTAP